MTARQAIRILIGPFGLATMSVGIGLGNAAAPRPPGGARASVGRLLLIRTFPTGALRFNPKVNARADAEVSAVASATLELPARVVIAVVVAPFAVASTGRIPAHDDVRPFP
jgi:hypothetical protein